MTFNELGLNARMVSRLDALGLTRPSPIQEQAIPQALQDRDGRAVAFCAADEVAELKAIEKVLGMRVEIAGGRAWEGFGDAPEAKKGRRSRQRSYSRRPERMAA